MQGERKKGFVVIDGALYPRSGFVARRTSIKDWALFGMIMLGLVASAVLAVTCVVMLVWAGVEAIGAIGRQIQAWH